MKQSDLIAHSDEARNLRGIAQPAPSTAEGRRLAAALRVGLVRVARNDR